MHSAAYTPPVQETFPVADGITAIDTKMVGRYLVTSGYLLDAEEPILVETGPATSADAVTRGLETLGVSADQLAHILVTHIHLDHAGGVGTLARRYPNATIWVHDRVHGRPGVPKRRSGRKLVITPSGGGARPHPVPEGGQRRAEEACSSCCGSC